MIGKSVSFPPLYNPDAFPWLETSIPATRLILNKLHPPIFFFFQTQGFKVVSSNDSVH